MAVKVTSKVSRISAQYKSPLSMKDTLVRGEITTPVVRKVK